MDTDNSDLNHLSDLAFDRSSVAHSIDTSSSSETMGEVTKVGGNTRVKVTPASTATSDNAKHPPSTRPARMLSQTATHDEPEFRRSSQVHPSLNGTAPERVEPYRKRSLILRRMDVWESEPEESSSPNHKRELAPGSISSLPIAVQAGFRRKVLLIFDLQLLLLTAMVSLLTYETNFSSLMDRIFYSEWILLAALAAMILSLLSLYHLHSRFPWNWVAMVVFTIVFSVLIAGVQVVLHTRVGVFCSSFTFLAMCVMTVLCGVKRTKDGQVIFLSALVAGFLSYAIITVGCGIVVGAFDVLFLDDMILLYALALEFALIMWFSHDAVTIFRLITPDEYMHGVIYFYTDVLVLTMISATAVALVLLCTACGGGSGGGGGFGYINPTGCSTGGCCCSCCGDGGDDDGMEVVEGSNDGPHTDGTAQQQRSEDMLRG